MRQPQGKLRVGVEVNAPSDTTQVISEAVFTVQAEGIATLTTS